MLNEVYKTIHAHKSVRKYLHKPVSTETLNRICEAATKASTSGNMQAYSIIITTDANLKKELLEPHFNQSMVTEAPVLMTFCADFNRMRLWLRQNEAPENFDNLMSFMIASIDAVLASQNAALAAESEGLGICYMGTTLASCDRIAEILKCPEHVIPIVGFSLGYPDETIVSRERLPLSGVVHQEQYRNYNPENIDKIYREKETKGLERYRSNKELNELIQKHGAENLAQVYTKVKYTRESHLGYSQTLFNFLKQQNFLNFD
ncbi:MAG: nitroreductase family protein [Pseudobdellovibrio sp.]